MLHAGDRIEIRTTLKNTTSATIRNIEYLDTLPKIFQVIPQSKYRVLLGIQSKENFLEYTQADDYSLYFQGFDIPAGQTLTFIYQVEALPTRYGKLIVDTLEK